MPVTMIREAASNGTSTRGSDAIVQHRQKGREGRPIEQVVTRRQRIGVVHIVRIREVRGATSLSCLLLPRQPGVQVIDCAVAILAVLAQAAPEAHAAAQTAAEIGLRLTGRHPNVDFALAAAAMGLGLPRNAALGLFIIGRTVGWIAHAIEQYESGVLIRPRARYLGPRPE